MNKGKVIVISGPSGCGKDTVINKLLERYGEKAFLSISMTTRPMRPGDEDGVSYFFVNEDEFLENVQNGKMLEYAKYGSNYYGTPLEPIESMCAKGKIVLLNIEVQGGANVRRLLPESKHIFLLPPSIEALRKRLRGRGSESEEAIEKRVQIAEEEIKHADEYDFRVVNDDLETAVDEIYCIINNTINN